MTPQERDLIESVFSRLNQMTNTPKDPEAAALIAERLRGLPDAAYGLVLAVVMQDVSIKQAQARITELERRVAEGSPAPSAGGFLGAAAVANPWAQSPPRAASPIPQVAPPMQQQYAPPPQSAPHGVDRAADSCTTPPPLPLASPGGCYWPKVFPAYFPAIMAEALAAGMEGSEVPMGKA